MKAQKKRSPRNHSYVINYLTLRKTLGIIGISFPIILIIGSFVGGKKEVLPSISHYYYSNMGDVFVSFLCVMAIFLFSYRGYDYKDRITGALAGIFALGVAFLPTDMGELAKTDGPLHRTDPDSVRRTLHFTSAALFLLSLAFFSIFLFTQKSKHPTLQKLMRNRIYRICGFVIVGCLVTLGVVFFMEWDESFLKPYKPVFVFESIALFAFGTSWLVKGEAILKDRL